MEKFFEEIKNLIPNDYDEFLKCYNEEPYKGLRVNTLKCTGEKLLSLLDFPLKKTPFCDNGYYYPNEEKGLGKGPLNKALDVPQILWQLFQEFHLHTSSYLDVCQKLHTQFLKER